MNRLFMMVVLILIYAGSSLAQGISPVPVLSLTPKQMFVGFTSTSHTGNIAQDGSYPPAGGVKNANAICDTQFPGARMCFYPLNAGDILTSRIYFSTPVDEFNILQSWPVDGVWIDPGGGACTNFTSSASVTAISGVLGVSISGGNATNITTNLGASNTIPTTSNNLCSTSRPIACCILGIEDQVYVPEPSSTTQLIAGIAALGAMCKL